MTDDPKTKPPIGLPSEALWQEIRMWEIIAALERHRKAGVNYPLEWIGELSARSGEVFKRMSDS